MMPMSGNWEQDWGLPFPGGGPEVEVIIGEISELEDFHSSRVALGRMFFWGNPPNCPPLPHDIFPEINCEPVCVGMTVTLPLCLIFLTLLA